MYMHVSALSLSIIFSSYSVIPSLSVKRLERIRSSFISSIVAIKKLSFFFFLFFFVAAGERERERDVDDGEKWQWIIEPRSGIRAKSGGFVGRARASAHAFGEAQLLLWKHPCLCFPTGPFFSRSLLFLPLPLSFDQSIRLYIFLMFTVLVLDTFGFGWCLIHDLESGIWNWKSWLFNGPCLLVGGKSEKLFLFFYCRRPVNVIWQL